MQPVCVRKDLWDFVCKDAVTLCVNWMDQFGVPCQQGDLLGDL